MDQDKLRDILYRHAVAARDIGQGLAGEFVSHYDAVEDDLVKEIASRYARIEAAGFDRGPATTKRLEDMLKATREVRAQVYKPASEGLISNLEKIAQTEYRFAANAVKSAGGVVDLATTIPSFEFTKNLILTTPIPFADDRKTLLLPWLAHWDAATTRNVEGALRIAAQEGQTTAEVVKRLIGDKDKKGILETSRRDATTIALSSNGAIQNNARLETFKRMKSIKFLEWSSILDSRTSEICQQRSGTIYPIDGPHPMPPAHPRCRSLFVPRRDDQGTKHKPFGEWLGDQPEAVQDEVLGKARADVFRTNPDFDFQGFFKESGGYKTLGELREYDARLFGEGGVKSPTKAKPKPEAPKPPEPVVEAPTRLTSAIDPAVNDNTVKVISRKQATTELSAKLSEAAKASAYDPRPEFRGVKAEQFGKAQLGAAFSDEAASTIAALWPELDRIADAFKVPRLRAIRTITGNSAIANMGDGTLGVHPVHFNGFASRVGLAEAGGDAPALIKVRKQQQEAKAELDRLSERLTKMKAEYDALDPVNDRSARVALAVNQRAVYADYRKLAQKEFKLRGQLRTMERQGGAEPVSEWKVGDDIKLRPYTNDKYFSGIDKMRSTLYHEFGHQLHQMLGKRGRRAVVGAPPLEKQLKTMFFNKFHGAAPGNIGGRGIERKNQLRTTYATTNEFEWWAESFSAYMMGRPDLADPDLVKLIEELLDVAANA